MREIKYRGKRIDNGSWIYGGLSKWDNKAGIVPVGCSFSKTRGGSNEHVVSAYMIETKTVGEYTGLKDKNGVEIYEGDKYSYNDGYEYGVVVFENGCFNCVSQDQSFPIYSMYSASEVIGNIHEENK